MEEQIEKIRHDLSSPLTVLQGFLSAINELEMSKEQRTYYEAALQSLQKIKTVIDEL